METNRHLQLAGFGEEFAFHAEGQDWITSWHKPVAPPDGKRHGSSGVCVTPNGYVVLVSENGADWQFPGGRPEGNEDWHQTLEREVWEEACAHVTSATLLGYNRGRCVRGHEAGLVLVRAMWRVEVELAPWQPEWEIAARALVRPDLVHPLMAGVFPDPIQRRWLQDAFANRDT